MDEDRKRLTAIQWGCNYLRTKGWEDGHYSQTWAEDAEVDGYFVWILDFNGSNEHYARISQWTTILSEMYGWDGFMIETGEGLMRVVFESASDAILFKFKLADLGV